MDAVRVLPPVFAAEKRELLAAADIFTNVSRWDVLPGAALEALSLGVPALVSPVTGLADFVTQNSAGLIARLQVDDLALQLANIANGEAQIAPAEAIAAATAQAFGPEPIARRFIAAYESVL
jgi:glycosyltransferase involved in cell wall biosynthesis